MFTLSASRVAAKAVTVRPTRAAKRSVAVKSTKVRATTGTRAINGPAIDPGGDRARARISPARVRSPARDDGDRGRDWEYFVSFVRVALGRGGTSRRRRDG